MTDEQRKLCHQVEKVMNEHANMVSIIANIRHIASIALEIGDTPLKHFERIVDACDQMEGL